LARGNGQRVGHIPRRRDVRGRDVPATRNARGRRRHRDVERKLPRRRPFTHRPRRRRSAPRASPAASRGLPNPAKQPPNITVLVDRAPVKVKPTTARSAGVRLLVPIVNAVQVLVNEVCRTNPTRIVFRRLRGRRIDRQPAVNQPRGHRSRTTDRGRFLPRRRCLPALFLRPAASLLFSRHPTSVLLR